MKLSVRLWPICELRVGLRPANSLTSQSCHVLDDAPGLYRFVVKPGRFRADASLFLDLGIYRGASTRRESLGSVSSSTELGKLDRLLESNEEIGVSAVG